MCEYCENYGRRKSYERNRFEKGTWAIYDHGRGPYVNIVCKPDVVNLPIKHCPNCGRKL